MTMSAGKCDMPRIIAQKGMAWLYIVFQAISSVYTLLNYL